jgi:hypothetical protein
MSGILLYDRLPGLHWMDTSAALLPGVVRKVIIRFQMVLLAVASLSGPMYANGDHDPDHLNRFAGPSSLWPVAAGFAWVMLDESEANGSCVSGTDCCADIICYGLEYTPGVTGDITTYTTGFFVDCITGMTPVVSNTSCVMQDNSFAINECSSTDSVLFNASGYDGVVPVTAGIPVIIHQVCFALEPGQSIVVSEDAITDLTLSIDLTGGGHVDEFPAYTATTISRPHPTWPPDMTVPINCIAQAVQPIPPVVSDLCGNVISSALIDVIENPDPLTCEGYRRYIFEYIDCAGNPHIWNFWYFVEYLPFSGPMDDGETVGCIDDIDINMIIPPAVNDHCGIPLTPVGPSVPVYDPPAFMCNGTVTYSWIYTDCEGNTVTWDYVYTVDPLPPTELGGPVDNDSTITCSLDANPPLQLPLVVDACGDPIPAPVPSVGGTYMGGCEGTITYTYVYTGCPGEDFIWVYTYTVSCFPIALHVFLEGPYDASGDSLLPDLNVNHVLPGQDKLLSPNLSVQLSAPFTPFGQPYNMAPWNYNGNTGLNFGDASAPGAPMGVIPYPEDVVDWILVTVRENGILPADNIWTCAGWVHTDGEVTFPEPCGTLSLDVMDNYYLLVQHRNHLGILSPVPVNEVCAGAILEWDFTTGNSYEPIFRDGQKELVPGIWGMFTANGEQISTIPAIASQDRTTWRILQNALGYSIGDHNMNVSTNSFDETLWKINQNTSSGVTFY